MTSWEQSLATLVRVHGKRLRRTAYLLCGDRVAADELVQETFVRALSRRRAGQLASGLDADDGETFLRRVMLGAYLDSDRRWRSGRHDAGAEGREATLTLAQLPPQGRACVVLRYDLGIDAAKIAGELGITPTAVARYLADARAILAAGRPSGDTGTWDVG